MKQTQAARLGLSALLTLTLLGCGSSDEQAPMQSGNQGNQGGQTIEPVEYDLDNYLGNKDIFISAGTGRFRVEKKDERWWLVTPEGNAFYSYAVQGVGSTGTGIGPREDNNFPYLNNILEKYGSIPAWANATVDLLKGAGFNTIGDFSEHQHFTGQMPYMTGMHISGHAPIIEGQPDIFRGGARDFYHPDFAAGAYADAVQYLTSCANDAYCIGAFFDDEVPWTASFLMPQPLFDGFQYLPANAPGKLALQEFLQEKYATIADFNAVWNSSLASFDDIQQLEGPVGDNDPSDDSAAQQADRQGFRDKTAKHYYATADAAMDAVSSTMLNMCGRFLVNNITLGVLQAASEHCDVISINAFDLPTATTQYMKQYSWTGAIIADPLFSDVQYMQQQVDKPVLLASFTYRAEAEGQNTFPPESFFGIEANQTERAAKFKSYMQRALPLSNVVGAHWFLHSDQPVEGRWDGENSTFGIVTIEDEPYEELIQAMKEISYQIYPQQD